jgi:hypothetical protein
MMSARWMTAGVIAAFAYGISPGHAADVVRALVPDHIEWCSKVVAGLDSLQTIEGQTKAYDSAVTNLKEAARKANIATLGLPYAGGISVTANDATLTFCSAASAAAPPDSGVTSQSVPATFFLALVCTDDTTDDCHGAIADYVKEKNHLAAEAVDELIWRHIKTAAIGEPTAVAVSALLNSSEFAIADDAPPPGPTTSTVVAVRDPVQTP